MAIAEFTTERLYVADWCADLADVRSRQKLVSELTGMLTPAVLAGLPPPLQLASDQPDLSGWIADRAAESDVLLARHRLSGDLLGLLILARFDPPSALTTIHVGYLFAQTAWRLGYATELLSGLVAACQSVGPLRLIAGLDRRNPASARVLQKVGFLKDEARSGGETDIYMRLID